jgi:hypothetical protein
VNRISTTNVSDMLLLWRAFLVASVLGSFCIGWAIGGRRFFRSYWPVLLVLTGIVGGAETLATYLAVGDLRDVAGLAACGSAAWFLTNAERPRPEMQKPDTGTNASRDARRSAQRQAFIAAMIAVPVLLVCIFKFFQGSLATWSVKEKLVTAGLALGSGILSSLVCRNGRSQR